jgi:tRNA(Ile2) C34 agmatinyltransferase TiaS
MSVHCDTCGVRVSSKGYLGGGIMCKDCSRARRNNDTDTLQKRIDRYGGGDEVDAQTTLEDLCYGDES